MKLKEAYSILEIPSTATPEEAKKKFKELAKKWHPDVNKDPDAEAKFKKINEAYQVVESGEEEAAPNDWFTHSPFSHIRDPFRTGKKDKRQYYGGNIDVFISVSFKESVLGTKKEIKFSRQVKCPHCQGSGDKPVNNGCKTCGGRGQTTVRQQNAIFIQTCPDCLGLAKTQSCNECNQSGVLDSEANFTVAVPPAVHNNSILRLAAIGNYSGTLLGLQDTYSDVHVHISVEPDPDMRLEGKDVVSDVKISLLDALRGCDRKVKTIEGSKKININAGSKNKDEVWLSVSGHIKHRVIINVEYPADVSKLVELLTQEGN